MKKKVRKKKEKNAEKIISVSKVNIFLYNAGQLMLHVHYIRYPRLY
jgi:hypothetical protein